MHRKTITAIAALAALSAAGGVAVASGSSGAGGSRLDDGKDLLPQAQIAEAQAIRAAQGAATGALNEVDLERRGGTLVFTVDVGSSDVAVDARSGKVVSVSHDD